MRYIDGDEHRENDEAKRQGVPIRTIAERRHMVDQPADYLWSVEKLDGVL